MFHKVPRLPANVFPLSKCISQFPSFGSPVWQVNDVALENQLTRGPRRTKLVLIDERAAPGGLKGWVEMDHAERARALFYVGYNCAQAVFCAFTDVTGLELETAARLASSFGGGLGRLREVCGTVSAAAMVLGLAKGYSSPGDAQAKKEHYALVRQFASRFQAAEGSIRCAELLARANVAPQALAVGGDPEERTAEYYKKRPCPELAWRAARILEELLGE